jgi:hypothetical protein
MYCSTVLVFSRLDTPHSPGDGSNRRPHQVGIMHLKAKQTHFIKSFGLN